MPSGDDFADSMAGMIRECRWLLIGVALSFSALACALTPMDEEQAGTINTTGGTGGGGTTATTGGSSGTTGSGEAIGGGGTVSTCDQLRRT